MKMILILFLNTLPLFATAEISDLMSPLIADQIQNPIKKGKIYPAMDGKISAINQKSISIEHHYLENHRIKVLTTTSCFKKQIIKLQIGDRVDVDTFLGYGKKVLIDQDDCTQKHPKKKWQILIHNNQKLLKPVSEKLIVIGVKHLYQFFIYQKGKLIKTYPIALSQQPIGPKEKRGDLKLPEGQYRICQKAKGPFGTKPWWFIYLGPAFLRISYPNRFDALNGLQKKIISKKQYQNFIKKERTLKIPPKHTALGSGILIHGWNGEWSLDHNRNLTWGCVSMRNSELLEFYRMVPNGTAMIILP